MSTPRFGVGNKHPLPKATRLHTVTPNTKVKEDWEEIEKRRTGDRRIDLEDFFGKTPVPVKIIKRPV